ncbi:phosphatase [Eubacterium barkeri]|uniref:Putative hydrolase n=1 Tax=Eubacterium barkeri TaxID=1528 RepID=A0A1H3BEC5_EUBBA|nr:phosphatase [Eubacterium barkeri]SDX40001.1 putative hydrolase [Eubacterium barkeri]
MRDYLMDGHAHTVVSGHAYNTVQELVDVANIRGLELICLTEHGPELPGAPHPIYFANYRIIPSVIDNVRVLKGIEANIMDFEGTLDIPERCVPNLEVISASLHDICLTPGSQSENTSAVLGAIENPLVDFLCHLGNPTFPLDYEAILQSAKKHDKMIEINNGSFFIRKGCAPNCVAIAKRCAELDIPIVVGSDTHYRCDLGHFPYADRALELAGVPDELIVNLEPWKFMDILKHHGKVIGREARIPLEDVFNFNCES